MDDMNSNHKNTTKLNIWMEIFIMYSNSNNSNKIYKSIIELINVNDY